MNIGKGLLSSPLLWAVILSLGVSGVPQAHGQESKPLSKKIICLLYTSPSPRDRTRSRMPSSA